VLAVDLSDLALLARVRRVLNDARALVCKRRELTFDRRSKVADRLLCSHEVLRKPSTISI